MEIMGKKSRAAKLELKRDGVRRIENERSRQRGVVRAALLELMLIVVALLATVLVWRAGTWPLSDGMVFGLLGICSGLGFWVALIGFNAAHKHNACVDALQVASSAEGELGSSRHSLAVAIGKKLGRTTADVERSLEMLRRNGAVTWV